MLIDNPRGGRRVEEWIGKTPESVPPDHVKLRIWQRQDSTDPETGLKLKSAGPAHAQLDHEIPLSEQWRYDYALNRESNLRYVATDTTHKEKTKAENERRAKANRGAIRHASIPAPKRPLQSRGFAQKRQREPKKRLPPRDVFTGEVYKMSDGAITLIREIEDEVYGNCVIEIEVEYNHFPGWDGGRWAIDPPEPEICEIAYSSHPLTDEEHEEARHLALHDYHDRQYDGTAHQRPQFRSRFETTRAVDPYDNIRF